LGILGRLVGRRHRFVLKARREGVWEEITEYDRYVGMSEISDVLDDLRDEGYDYVRLDEVDEEGRKVKVVWSKKWSKKTSGVQRAVSEIKEYAELLKTIREVLKGEESDPFAAVASAVSFLETFRKVCDAYPVLCGKERSFDRVAAELMLRMLGFDGGSSFLSSQQPVQQSVQQPQLVLQNMPSVPRLQISPEVAEKFNKIVEESVRKASDLITTECMVEEKCLEPFSKKVEEELENE